MAVIHWKQFLGELSSNLASADSKSMTLTQFQDISGLQVAHLYKREAFIRAEKYI